MVAHPGIAQIYEAAEHDGVRFIAMELVPGETLEALLKRGPLPLSTALDYASQILEAIDAAHAAGVVHRDLKPSNIMITAEGRTKIVDFGLAKVTAPFETTAADTTTSLDWSRVTAEGSFAGTLAYMSPEQAEGRAVDARSDIFSFGAVLYEMLTGEAAFARESPVATIVAVMSEQPKASPLIAPLLWSVLELAVNKDPRHRWRDAGDLKRSLELATAPPPPGDTAIQHPESRRQFLGWVSSAGVIMAAGAFVAGRRSVRHKRPSFERLTFDSGTMITARYSPAGDSAFVTYRAPGQASFYIYELRFGSRSLRRLDLPPANIQGVSNNGDLAFIMREGANKAILARASREGGPYKALVNQAAYACFGPDGSRLMVARGADQYRLEYPLGTVLAEAENSRGLPFQYANLSHDGQSVAYFRPQEGTRFEELCVLETGAPRQQPRVISADWAETSPLHWTWDNDGCWFEARKPGKQSAVWS